MKYLRSNTVYALGFIRLAESSFTAIAYLTAGLITPLSLRLIPQILPSVFIGVPIELSVVDDAKGQLDAYHRLLADAMEGDPTLFAREDEVEEAWDIVEPVLRIDSPESFG